MATRIRLKRMGAKKNPFYRIVVADSRFPRDGRFIEEIGYYNPTKDPIVLKVDEEKAMRWLNSGAQPSDTARALLGRAGVLQKLAEAKKGQIG
ncbi:MAG: 30S ribosomal protein S16 [Syntrophomonadaceae bacterium]|nr:30S ribosomal protein S16 [Syntrophomonadaceae bacterium]